LHRASPRFFVRDRLTWLSYILIGYYSYLLNALGPSMPFLRADLDLSYAMTSLHVTAFAVGMIIAGVLGDRIVARWGRRITCWMGAGGMALGAALLVISPALLVSIISSLLMGSLGSLLLAILPAVLSDHHGQQRSTALSEANVMGSICASVAPLIIGTSAASVLGWRAGLLVAPFVLLALLPWLSRVPFPTPRGSASARAAARRPLPRAYWLYWIVIVCVVALEFCMIIWGANYLTLIGGFPATQAAMLLSLFLGAMIFGRWLGSRLTRRISAARLLTMMLTLVGLAFPLFWFPPTPALMIIGLVGVGLGIANLYPLSLALAVGAAADQPDLAGARATLASGTAIGAAPLILAALADYAGFRIAYSVVVVLVIAAASAHGGSHIAARRQARRAAL